MKIEDLQLLKRILEGALMAADGPLSRRAIKELFDELERPEDELLNQAIEELQADCETRGYELVKVASGYRYQVKQDLSRWVGKLWKERAPRYSRALLETLSLVAYRQPITRGEIEDIRGVAVSTQIIKTLLEREWVKVVGHRDVPGRPAIYATTKQFLDYFNLSNLDQLPPLAEIRDLSTISREFNIEMPPEMVEQVAAEHDVEGVEAANDAQEDTPVETAVDASDEMLAETTDEDEGFVESDNTLADESDESIAVLESWGNDNTEQAGESAGEIEGDDEQSNHLMEAAPSSKPPLDC